MGQSTDWNAIRNAVEEALKGQVNSLVDGSIGNINGPMREAANRMTVAIRSGPTGEKLIPEIRDQLELSLRIEEIRLKAAAQGSLNMILGIGLNLLFQGVTAGLGAIKVN